MNFVIRLLVLLMLLPAVACGKENPGVSDLPKTEPHEDVVDDSPQPSRELRILSVGNSYSVDALVYVPFIMKELLPDWKFTIAILGTGARSLEQHYTLNMCRDNKYDYYYKSDDYGAWESLGRSRIVDVVTDEDWDLILLQQVSGMSADYSTYHYASLMVEWLSSRQTNAQYGWILTPAYPDGGSRLRNAHSAGTTTGFSSSDEMYAAVSQCAYSLKEDDGRFSLVCPVGTAVQNARHTSLDGYGRSKHMTYDGLHLQDGIGRTVAALAMCQSIIEFYDLEADLEKCGFIVTDEFYDSNCITSQKHGTVTGMSEENLQTAILCAKAASESPFAVSVDGIR